MSNCALTNCNKCDNPKCKLVKNHNSPCSDVLNVGVSRCVNPSCTKANNHYGDCSDVASQSMMPYQTPNMFNMQYQSLVNDHTSYSNFNNNNDQRKFVINYVTINNNYYGNSSTGSYDTSSQMPKLEEMINTSGFMPQFSNPSTHLSPYRR